MFTRIFRAHDWIITIAATLLLILGITTLYSTSFSSSLTAGDFHKQVLFGIISLVLYFAVSSFDYTLYKYKEVLAIIYAILFFLLILLKILNRSVRNTERWLSFIGGLNIQPSELAKIAVILLTAAILASSHSLRTKVLLSLCVNIPLFALVYIQPSLGATIILIAVWVVIVFYSMTNQLPVLLATALALSVFLLTSGIIPTNIFILGGVGILIVICLTLFKKFWYIFFISLFIGMVIGLTGKTIVWAHLQPYQKARIVNFVNPSGGNTAGNFQTRQSQIAFGSGGITGKGFAQGTQTRLNFLPEYQTDFIFSAYGEEFGLVGVTLVYALYIILLFKLVIIMDNTQDVFGYLIIVGVITMILLQILINMGMNLGILPVTGIPLPFFSYGGSSLITIFLCLGIIQSIYKRRVHLTTQRTYSVEDL